MASSAPRVRERRGQRVAPNLTLPSAQVLPRKPGVVLKCISLGRHNWMWAAWPSGSVGTLHCYSVTKGGAGSPEREATSLWPGVQIHTNSQRDE